MRAIRTMLAVLIATAAAGAAWAQAAKPSIAYLEGTVTIDGAPAAIGDPVPLGSTVVTGAQSLCEIRWNVKNIVRLSAATTFVFNPGNLQVGSELRTGAIALILRNVAALGAGPGFVVRTSNAVAGVRGTSFFINAVDASTTYVCTCNGSLHIEDAAGASARDVVAAHHKGYLFTTGASGVTLADAGLLYHTDADMEKLAAKIGVAIDWTTPDR
jgi:hypothetical protein